MKRRSGRDASAVFAQRVVEGVDDGGASETVVIWIERKAGAVWAVGRAVNPQHRPSEEPRRHDYPIEGYELEGAVEQANECLEDDMRVPGGDGHREEVQPFAREELLK